MKKYQIIYADPPWNYTATSNKIPCRAKDGQPYNAMRMVDVYGLNVKDISEKNCVLFLWATAPLLPEAIYLIKCWGFDFKTFAFTWIKKNKKNKESLFWGMGSWTRSNPEFCLLAIKGNPKAISHSVHSVIEHSLLDHSIKPEIIKNKIIELCGNLPKIELFARQKTEGWDVWGNEVKSDIDLTSNL